jgi:hypothetical protein
VDTSGYLNTPILACAPELKVDKANDTGGIGRVNMPFDWTLTVANTGVMSATFYAGQRILEDELPPGLTYDPPTVGSVADVSNSANIKCRIAGDILTCHATGANVTLAAATGSFQVVIPATPLVPGVVSNPAGNCRVDPDGHVTEADEGNNNCLADTVNVTYWRVYLPAVLR